jgi:hypothetical protein
VVKAQREFIRNVFHPLALVADKQIVQPSGTS